MIKALSYNTITKSGHKLEGKAEVAEVLSFVYVVYIVVFQTTKQVKYPPRSR
jgi:hypothetical protein